MINLVNSTFLLALLAANAFAQVWQPVQDIHPNPLSMSVFEQKTTPAVLIYTDCSVFIS
jgi:hypothetical protein